MSSIHIVDNNSVTKETKQIDRPWKLHLSISNLRGDFLEVSPEEFNAVDEIMILFKRKSILQQNMPKKSNKRF